MTNLVKFPNLCRIRLNIDLLKEQFKNHGKCYQNKDSIKEIMFSKLTHENI